MLKNKAENCRNKERVKKILIESNYCEYPKDSEQLNPPQCTT